MSPRRRRRSTGRRGPFAHPVAMALAVILAAAAISFYAFNEGLPFVHGFRVHAVMANANALRRKSPVRIAGVTVGKVLAVSAGPGATTKVDMELRSSALPIHRDATIRVRPRLFVEGGYYVDLSPGSPGSPEMDDGGTIPLPQTRSAVQLYQLLSVFNRSTRSSLRNFLKTSAGSLAHGGVRGLRRAAQPLAPALRDVAIVSQAAQGKRPHDVSTAVGGTSRVTSALAADEAALGGLVTNLNTTAAALAVRDGALGDGIAALDDVLRAAPPALGALDATLPSLERFSRALDPGLVEAPALLRQILTAVREFGALVAPAQRRRVVAALRAAFVDFPDLLTRLSTLISVGKPITDCVTSHVAPVLKAEVPDGDLSTGRPVWQDLAHLLPGLASAAQNFDGNGYGVRYQAGFGPANVSTGSLVGAQPGSSAPVGSRPVWHGRLTPSDFRPDQPCDAQPVPSLASPTGPAGLTSTRRRSRPAPPTTPRDLRALLRLARTRGAGR